MNNELRESLQTMDLVQFKQDLHTSARSRSAIPLRALPVLLRGVSGQKMRLLFLTFLLFVSQAYARDYSDMVEGKDISWELTADSLMSNLQPDKTVAWFGALKQNVTFKNDLGVTIAMFLFENHRIVNSSPESLNEPLQVKKTGVGHFVVVLELKNLEPDEVRSNMLDKLKHPQYAIVVGRPAQLGKFGAGVPAVMLYLDKMQLSDEMVVRFEAGK